MFFTENTNNSTIPTNNESVFPLWTVIKYYIKTRLPYDINFNKIWHILLVNCQWSLKKQKNPTKNKTISYLERSSLSNLPCALCRWPSGISSRWWYCYPCAKWHPKISRNSPNQGRLHPHRQGRTPPLQNKSSTTCRAVAIIGPLPEHRETKQAKVGDVWRKFAYRVRRVKTSQRQGLCRGRSLWPLLRSRSILESPRKNLRQRLFRFRWSLRLSLKCIFCSTSPFVVLIEFSLKKTGLNLFRTRFACF